MIVLNKTLDEVGIKLPKTRLNLMSMYGIAKKKY
jgi:hypothetical protein